MFLHNLHKKIINNVLINIIKMMHKYNIILKDINNNFKKHY